MYRLLLFFSGRPIIGRGAAIGVYVCASIQKGRNDDELPNLNRTSTILLNTATLVTSSTRYRISFRKLHSTFERNSSCPSSISRKTRPCTPNPGTGRSRLSSRRPLHCTQNPSCCALQASGAHNIKASHTQQSIFNLIARIVGGWKPLNHENIQNIHGVPRRAGEERREKRRINRRKRLKKEQDWQPHRAPR